MTWSAPRPLVGLALALALVLLALPAQGQKAGKQPVRSKRPVADKEAKLTAARKSQTVIVEGLGKTVEDAEKDAFRNAVRQVVGAVVDEETLLKNDQIISDKLLTASNGFVASHERLKVSEEGGLIRIKIKAKVEKTELVDKLRELKITTVAVKTSDVLPDDADRRFSDERVKEMTKAEAIRNKTELLQDALADFPKVLEARAKTPDRFDYDEDSSTLKVEVVVTSDNKRYNQFLKRLELRLKKLSLNQGIATADAVPKDIRWGSGGKPGGFQSYDCTGLAGPDLSRQSDLWCLWILTNVFKGGAGTRWTGYVLDSDPRKSLTGLHSEFKIQVTLRDADGTAIVEEILDLTKSSWLGLYMNRPKVRMSHDQEYPILAPANKALSVTQERSVNVMLAPMEFTTNWAHVISIGQGATQIAYAPSRTYPLKINIDKDEVKRIGDIRCTVLFRPHKAPDE